MATLTINGRKVKVDDSFLSLTPEQQNATVDEIAASFDAAPAKGDRVEAKKPETGVDAETAKRDKYYSSGIYSGAYNPLGAVARTIDAAASGAQRAPMFGWDDEAQAAVSTGGGMMGDYSRARAKFDAQKQSQRQSNPIASAVGEIAGGVVTAGSLGTRLARPPVGSPFASYASGPGLTLAGRSLPVIGRTGAAALEGAAYGGVTGAGEAQPGERLAGAGMGATVGAATGAAASKVGDMLAGRAARSVSQATAPTTDDLAAASNALYSQADQAGISIKPQTTNKLVNNMKMAAGELNVNLRPRTAGVVQDINSIQDKPLTLKQLDEVRQSIGLAMKNADAQDVRTLQRMKTIVDSFSDNVTPGDVTGDVRGFSYIKQARDLWSKKSKADAIETLFDLSDVDSAKYSQSGMSNAIRLRAKQLYTRIATGKEKGFTDAETALVRKLAKGEMTPAVVNWVAKFAPRGVISFGAGVGLGGALGGPVGAAIPGMIGFGAGQLADRAAIGGVTALRNAAATGQAPVLNAITNRTVPFIGGASSGLASQITRTR